MITNVNQLADLPAMLANGYIYVRKHPTADLFLYNYTARAQYGDMWNEATMTCRGLITDAAGEIVARPFRKFFNLEEVKTLPDEPFEVFDKVDGSLGIMYWLDGRPYIATRGRFDSEHAETANRILANTNASLLNKDHTYLFEIIAPEHRIVVDYEDRRALILLAIIKTKTGEEITLDEATREAMASLGFETVYSYGTHLTLEDILSMQIPDAEGFVIRFASGLRVKVKMEEYKRLHKIITGVTEKDILVDYLMPGNDMDPLLERVPDEFYHWVKETVGHFQDRYKSIERTCNEIFFSVTDTTRKGYATVFTRTRYAPILFNMLDQKPYDQLIWKMLLTAKATATTFRRGEV